MQSDELTNLAEAALWIARDEYPALNIAQYLDVLDSMAGALKARVSQTQSVSDTLTQLNAYLFEELGFHGNRDDYYDPRNSFLNEVIDRRQGIPISLSVLYLEIGWRVGLSLAGVSFPGHFLVKLTRPDGAWILDPYAQGEVLGMAELRRRLEQSAITIPGDDVDLSLWLRTASKREILVRMLRNLKGIYVEHGADDKVLSILNRILILAPDAPLERRERAALYERLDCFRAAADDYRLYLQRQPEAPDGHEIMLRINELTRRGDRLN